MSSQPALVWTMQNHSGPSSVARRRRHPLGRPAARLVFIQRDNQRSPNGGPSKIAGRKVIRRRQPVETGQVNPIYDSGRARWMAATEWRAPPGRKSSATNQWRLHADAHELGDMSRRPAGLQQLAAMAVPKMALAASNGARPAPRSQDGRDWPGRGQRQPAAAPKTS
jgi:hypothetical protein